VGLTARQPDDAGSQPHDAAYQLHDAGSHQAMPDVSYMMPEVGQMMPEVMRMPRAMVDGPSCGGGSAAVTCDVIVVVVASFIHTHTHTHTRTVALCEHMALLLPLPDQTRERVEKYVAERKTSARRPRTCLCAPRDPCRAAFEKTWSTQGCSGAGTRRDGVPLLFSSTGGRVPHSPTFWTEMRAKVSPLLQLVTY